MHKLILASESPRRKKIFEAAHLSFQVFSVKVSESIEKNLTSESEINDEILRIARTKGQAAMAEYKSPPNGQYLFIAADTMVIYEHKTLGKPKSSTEAESFLSELSGKTHQVKTGVCIFDVSYQNGLLTQSKVLEFIETTEVQFRLISRQEILDYIATGEPMDKAGAYAIQGGAQKFVLSTKGSFQNVVGFPIERFLEFMKHHKIQLPMMTYEEIYADIKKFSSSARPVEMIAVSKLQPPEKISELINLGHRHFAENYVQEALTKLEIFQEHKLHWHFIGHLQKNKVKQVVGKFEYIHSVDSLELAEKISTVAVSQSLKQKIFLQVNVGGEASKGGFEPKDVQEYFPALCKLPGLHIVGLMTMPPLFENSEDVRPLFAQLKQLTSSLNLRELSMGTSSDYKVALEEGATMVRLGTVVFGERPARLVTR